MAKKLAEVENPMVLERPAYRSPEPVYPIYRPDPVCECGCNQSIEVVEYRTHEGEPVASESCFMRIAYREGWLKRVG
jgi:hypothetical protein